MLYVYVYIYIYDMICKYLCMFGGPIGSWAFTPPRHGLRFLAPAPRRRCAGRAAGAPTGLGARGFLAAAVVPWRVNRGWE